MYFKVVNILANFNIHIDLFDTPATARDVHLLTVDLCNVWLRECIENHDNKGEELAKKFIHLFNLRFPKLIGKQFLNQTHKEISRGLPVLPSLEDIKNNAFTYLKKKFKFGKACRDDIDL